MSTSAPCRPELRRTELLAPAGDWEALRAAVAGGADAVYFGLSNFNARHRATNFPLEELPRVIEFLHERNVRGYVTLNTLIFSDELEDVAQVVLAASAAGVDALIVQDLGLARLVRQLAPGLPLHGSTQMTLTEPRGIELVKQLGVERVILARELSLADITAIRQQTDMPLEVFVHGALCVAYSGQCLTSEALGGRSANRGQCAQACRLPYDLIVDGRRQDLGEVAYLLSPQDLAAYDQVAALVEQGVASLKIEGRLKGASYVSVATETYRAALDAALDGRPFELSRSGLVDLTQTFSRGFAPGFLEGVDHQQLVEGRFPKSRGVRVGTVAGHSRRGLLVTLEPGHEPEILKPGDGVVFDQGRPDTDEHGGRVYASRPQFDFATSRQLELEFGHEAVDLSAIQPGNIVWRTDDPELRKRTARRYAADLAVRRVRLDVCFSGRAGGPLEVSARDSTGAEASTSWAGPLEVARKHPLAEAAVREQFGRLAETPYELGQVQLELADPVMVPKSVMNELRRSLVASLAEARKHGPAPRPTDPTALVRLRADVAQPRAPAPATPQLRVLVRSLDQLQALFEWAPPAGTAPLAGVYCDFEDVRRYREAVTLARAAGLPIAVATLRVIKPSEEGLLRQIAKSEPDGVLVRNLAAVSFYRQEFPELPLVGDYALNAANELTADLLRGYGLARLVPSYDLDWEQLSAMLGRIDPAWLEIVVHQHMPMFHMEHCVFAARMSDGKDFRDCGRPCDTHRVSLRDRVGAEFPLLADTGCRNTVYNAVAQSAAELVPRMLAHGLRYFRVELLRETWGQVGPLLDRYARVLSGVDDGRSAWRGLQVLDQLGVTRGTFRAH